MFACLPRLVGGTLHYKSGFVSSVKLNYFLYFYRERKSLLYSWIKHLSTKNRTEKIVMVPRPFLLIFILGILLSCTQKPAKTQAESYESKLKKEAVAIAKDYASRQLKAPTTMVDDFGNIIINDNQKRYRIEPSKILTGKIDGDENIDALVTLTSNYKQDIGMPEHLILLNTNGKLMLEKVFELDMKVVKLKDRIITAELHTKPRTSPLYNCSHCIEIVNFKYSNGELVKLK